MVSMWLVAVATFLFVVVLFLGIAYYKAHRYGSDVGDATITRGMSGLAGQTVQLQCPPGKVISFTNNNPTTSRGVIVSSGDPGCDGFWQPSGQGQLESFFNSEKTIDVMSSVGPFTDLLSLEGQNSGTWTIPLQNDSRIPTSSCISSTTGQVQFVGTYDCV